MQGENSPECLGLKFILKSTGGIASEEYPWGTSEVSVKHVKHMAQMYLHNQFQEYSSWWPLSKNRRDYYL